MSELRETSTKALSLWRQQKKTMFQEQGGVEEHSQEKFQSFYHMPWILKSLELRTMERLESIN